MKALIRKTAFILLLALSCMAAAAQEQIKVDAPDMVAADERFNVTFIIEGEVKPSSFSWDAGSDFTLVWGPQTGSSTSIRIVNGKRSKSSQYTYTYIISPKKTGKFELPAATAKIKGETVVSRHVAVEVLSGNASSPQGGSSSSSSSQSGTSSSSSDVSGSDLFLRFTLSRTSAVIGEPITAELKLYQRVDIAGFEGAKFPSFNGFWSQETAAPSNIEFHRENIGDQLYNAALLRRYVLIPQQAGNLTIDPAELVCLVNVRTASRQSSIFDSFFDTGSNTVRKRITTPAVHVQVKPLPSGAPASFGGGVGNFRISAALSKDHVKTHEATSLVVTVSGKGNVSLLEAPKIDFPPDLEVYDTKTTDNADKSNGGTSGSKTFEYPFIPRSSGEFTIGPVEYSYYDVNAGKYVTVSTEPISFNVEKGEAAADGGSGSQLVSVDRNGVRNLGEDVRFIRMKQPAYKFNTGFFVESLPYWITVIVMILAAVMAVYMMKGFEARRADVAGNRNRKAVKMAMTRLRNAEDFLKKNLYSAFYEELHKALLGFVSDKLNMGGEDLNRENISARLVDGGVTAELADEFVSLLDACEFARYSPDGGNEAMNTHYNEAVKVISSIDSVMKGHSRNSAAKSAVMTIAMLLAIPGISGAENTDYLDSLWQKGVSSYTSGQWSESIDAWKSLEDTGVETPDLYYNLGNAYFKSGDYARAVLYYERTLKSDPSYSDARFNLDFADGLIRDKIDGVPEFVLKSWARKLSWCFSSDTWAVISLMLLALSLALAVLFFAGTSPRLRRTGFYGGIAAILLSASAFGFAKWQKISFLKDDHAVVMVPVSSVKSSPSQESSKDLFVLHEGTKVRILDSVGEWKNISLSDGRQGWIKDNDIEII